METSPPNDHESTTGLVHISYKKVKGIHGRLWITQAFTLFRASLGVWFGIVSVIFILLTLFSSLAAFLMPIGIGGLMLGCHQFHQNKPLKFEHLFSAVRSDGKELLKLSILYAFLSFLIIIAAVYVMALLGVELDQLIPEDFAQMQQAQQVEWMESAIQSDLLATLALFILVLFGLMIPLFMAYWFAPALIVLKKISALNALKLSFLACKDNFLAFLIYSVVAFGYLMIFFLLTSIFLVAIPPLGFIILLAGYMAIFAIMLASIYTAYIDIFDQPEQNNEIGENDDSSSTMFA